MNDTQRLSQDEGMTLIELLVVMFIISVLAGMLMPVMWTARERAQVSVCVSNMRQVLLGLQAYMVDYDEIPLDNRREGQQLKWAEAVLPYVGDPRVFLCSGDPDKGQSAMFKRGIPCSFAYYYNPATVEHFGGEGRQVAPDSVVVACWHHELTDRIMVLGRKDTSVEVAPLGKYATVHLVFE